MFNANWKVSVFPAAPVLSRRLLLLCHRLLLRGLVVLLAVDAGDLGLGLGEVHVLESLLANLDAN